MAVTKFSPTYHFQGARRVATYEILGVYSERKLEGLGFSTTSQLLTFSLSPPTPKRCYQNRYPFNQDHRYAGIHTYMPSFPRPVAGNRKRKSLLDNAGIV